MIQIPKELLHIILGYDGRIKYRKGNYVDIIHKNDERYSTITPILSKKIEIMKTIEFDDAKKGFYFEVGFHAFNQVGIVYDYDFSYNNKFEICYYDLRDKIIQIRTYL
jgi:hypothetical protein